MSIRRASAEVASPPSRRSYSGMFLPQPAHHHQSSPNTVCFSICSPNVRVYARHGSSNVRRASTSTAEDSKYTGRGVLPHERSEGSEARNFEVAQARFSGAEVHALAAALSVCWNRNNARMQSEIPLWHRQPRSAVSWSDTSRQRHVRPPRLPKRTMKGRSRHQTYRECRQLTVHDIEGSVSTPRRPVSRPRICRYRRWHRERPNQRTNPTKTRLPRLEPHRHNAPTTRRVAQRHTRNMFHMKAGQPEVARIPEYRMGAAAKKKCGRVNERQTGVVSGRRTSAETEVKARRYETHAAKGTPQEMAPPERVSAPTPYVSVSRIGHARQYVHSTASPIFKVSKFMLQRLSH